MPRTNTKTQQTRRNEPYPRPDAQPQAPSSDATLLPSSPTVESGDEDTQPVRHRRLNTDSMVTKRGRSKKKESKDKVHDRILQLAQFIKRNVDLFVHVPTVMNFGVGHETIEDYRIRKLAPGVEGYNKDELEQAKTVVAACGNEEEIYMNAYNGLRELFKKEWGYICGLNEDEEAQLWREVKHQACQGRNNDKSTLKQRTYKIAVKRGLLDPMVDDDDRSSFGTNHPQLLRMIVPMSILHKYGNDPLFEKDVRDEKYKIDNSSLPAFMFDVDNYNPESAKDTLLKGHLPVRVLQHIYTSPKSATDDANELNERKGTRESNAQIAGIKEVSPEMIAYACVHARLMISKMKQWSEVDELFNVKTFYYQILKLFKNRRSKWVRETLEWLTQQVFHRSAEQDDEEDEPNPDDETSFANILAAVEDDEDEGDDPLATTAEATATTTAATARTRAQTQASQTQADSQYSHNAFGELDD